MSFIKVKKVKDGRKADEVSVESSTIPTGDIQDSRPWFPTLPQKEKFGEDVEMTFVYFRGQNGGGIKILESHDNFSTRLGAETDPE